MNVLSLQHSISTPTPWSGFWLCLSTPLPPVRYPFLFRHWLHSGRWLDVVDSVKVGSSHWAGEGADLCFCALLWRLGSSRGSSWITDQGGAGAVFLLEREEGGGWIPDSVGSSGVDAVEVRSKEKKTKQNKTKRKRRGVRLRISAQECVAWRRFLTLYRSAVASGAFNAAGPPSLFHTC